MKLYAYLVFKGTDEMIHRRKLEYDVIDKGFLLINATGEKMITPWDGDFSESDLERVFTRSYFPADIEYAVHLLEDDNDKAMNLIKAEAQKDLKKLQMLMDKQYTFLDIICQPPSQIKTGLQKEPEEDYEM